MKFEQTDEYALQIIKNLRGNLSQVAFSEELGYGFNKVYRWESQKEPLKWEDFLNIVELRKLPLKESLKEYFAFSGDYRSQAKVLSALTKNYKPVELSEKLGVSKFVLYRYLNNQTELKFNHFLSLTILCSTFSLHFWLKLLGQRYSPKALSKEFEAHQHWVKTNQDFPYIPIVQRILDLKKYRESKEADPKDFLEKNYKIDFPNLGTALKEMIANGLLKKEKSGKIKSIYEDIGSVLKRETSFTFMTYWFSQAAKSAMRAIPRKNGKSIYAYHGFNCDKKTHKELQKLTFEYIRKVESIATNYERDKKDNSADEDHYLLIMGFLDPKE